MVSVWADAACASAARTPVMTKRIAAPPFRATTIAARGRGSAREAVMDLYTLLGIGGALCFIFSYFGTVQGLAAA